MKSGYQSLEDLAKPGAMEEIEAAIAAQDERDRIRKAERLLRRQPAGDHAAQICPKCHTVCYGDCQS